MQDVQSNRARKRNPTRKLVGWGALAGVVVIIAAVFLISHRSAAPTAPATQAALEAASSSTSAPDDAGGAAATAVGGTDVSAAPVVDLAAMDQPARRAFVLKLIRQGVFTGVVTTNSPPKVGVTPLFQSLSVDLKRQFAAVVEAYAHDGAATTEALQLIDATNGKMIGTYTVADGLKLL